MNKRLLFSLLFLLSVAHCFAADLVPMAKKGKWGYVSSDNCTKFVINPIYDDAYPFYEGRAKVVIDGRYGFINEKGELIIKNDYMSADDYYCGYSICARRGFKGIIDLFGRECVPFEYTKITRSVQESFYIGRRPDNTKDIIKVEDGKRSLLNCSAISEDPDVKYNCRIVQIGESYNVVDPNGRIVFSELKRLNNNYYSGSIEGDSSVYILRITGINGLKSVYRFSELYENDGIRVGKQGRQYGILNDDYCFITDDDYTAVQVITSDCILLEKPSGKMLINSHCEVLVNDIISFTQNGSLLEFRKGNGILYYWDLEDKSIGFIVNQKKIKVNGGCDGVIKEKQLYIWLKDNNTYGVINEFGTRLFEGKSIRSIISLDWGYFAISENGKDYYLAGPEGKIYNELLSSLKKCVSEGVYLYTDVKGDTKYLFLRDDSPYSLNGFEGNSLTSFQDLVTKKYGVINDDFVVTSKAVSPTEVKAPADHKWIKGTTFSNISKKLGQWWGSKMLFWKGDLDVVTIIDYGSHVYRQFVEIWMSDGHEQGRYGKPYTIKGNTIDIVGDLTYTIEYPYLKASNGEVWTRESSSYSSPLRFYDDALNTIVLSPGEKCTNTLSSFHIPEEYELAPKLVLKDGVQDMITVKFSITPVSANALVKVDDLSVPLVSIQSAGNHTFEVSAKGYKSISGLFKPISGTTMTYYLLRQYQQKNRGYLGLGYQFGNNTSIGASLGGYFNNVNIEGSFGYGLSSTNIYWLNSIGYSPAVYTYTPLSLCAKAGYGIIVGRSLRLTPQVGAGAIMLNGKVVDPGYSDPKASAAYQIAAQANVRIGLAFTSGMELFVTPSYSISVYKSPLYNHLSEYSTVVSNYGEGFNTQLGVAFLF